MDKHALKGGINMLQEKLGIASTYKNVHDFVDLLQNRKHVKLMSFEFLQ